MKGAIKLKSTEQELMAQYGLTPLPKKTVEAMAYVPFQPNNAETYAVFRGFEAGTMYKSLDKPFCPDNCGGKML